MRKFGLLGTSALGSAAFFGLSLALAAPAYAQDSAPPAQQDCTPDQQAAGNCVPTQPQTQSSDQTINVTGTRIRRPNLESPVPITSLTPDELPAQGGNNLGDSLNNLPSLRSTFSQQNSGRFIGTAGQNFLDLRGLGTNRTLVLVNGRRHVTASAGDFTPDVNTIPQDLLERVDVVTGGESAVYGSDAMAGVVNFVLMRNFDGLKIRGQGGASTYGDRGNYFTSITAGRNFADGRGNIAFAFEYAHANPLYVADRQHYAQTCGFVRTQNTAAESMTDSNSDGTPDDSFLCNIRSPGITAGGAIGGLGSGRTLAFDSNGNLVVAVPDSFTASGAAISTDPLTGITVNERDQLAVGNDRWTANLLAHFDVSDAFRPFLEAKYVRQRVLQEGQPTFFQGFLSDFFGIVPDLRCNNAFLNAQALDTLQSFGLCGDPDNDTFPINRFNVDWGGRAEVDTRQTYRIVAGVEGDFNDDWHYEVALNYGHFKSRNVENNNLFFADVDGNPAGFALAVDAVRDGNGNIVCGVNADADPSNDAPGCVPIDLFGFGAASQAALDYVNTTSFIASRASELDITAYISGDSSQLFELPGGPIGFSIGAEYRRETAFSTADPLSQAGGTFFNAFSTFDPPAFDVKEIYGEISLPILRDLPFARELTISAAGRLSDYNTGANHTTAWNINGIWAPVRDIKFRANYSRSVRVPTLNDLYLTPTQNFAFLNDPCDITNIGAGNNRANCAAFGVPTTVAAGSPCVGQPDPNAPTNDPNRTIQAGDPFVNCVTNGVGGRNISVVDAGNPNLEEEVGKSFTVGFVLTPRFLPGFSLTVDYFDIKISNLIAVLDAQTILSNCFSATDIDNQFCQLLNPRDQFGLFGDPALTESGVNYAKQTSRGIDFDLSYRRSLGHNMRINLRGLGTYTLERNNYTDPTDPTIYTRQLSNLGDPVFSGSLSAGLEAGPFSFNWTTRYIGRQEIFAYETTHSVQGRPPTNPDIAAVTHYPAVWYHDVRVQARVDNHLSFYVGADNLFNRLPPFGNLGNGAGGAIFDSIGRFVYGGARVDF